MNRFLSLFILLLFSCSSIINNNCCSYNYNNPVEPISNIWKITKPGYQTSYIIGSFHFGKQNSKLPDNIKNLIKQSNVVVTEIALKVAPNSIEDSKYRQYLNSSQDKNIKLSDKIGENLYEDIVTFIKQNNKNKNQIPDITFFEPWFLINIMTVYLFNDYNFYKSLDYLIVQEAIYQNKKLDYLENLITLQKIFSKIPVKYIIPELKRYVIYDNIIRKEAKMSYDFYINRKYKELLDLQFEGYSLTYSSKKDERFWLDFSINKIIYNRNKLWTKKILNLLERDSTIIVVGFLHLFTPKGLIKILQDKGYQVTPVN